MKVFVLIISFVLLSCSKAQFNANAPVSQTETVMCEGMSIVAINITGTMKITAGKGYERFYTWDGETRSQILEPRKERWVGRFGIVDKKGASWKSNHSITEANLEEAQLHFETIEDALKFIRHRGRLDGNTVYNDQGIVVTWSKAIHPLKNEGNVLLVDVWQVLIKGKKPSELPGSHNDKIIVTQPCSK